MRWQAGGLRHRRVVDVVGAEVRPSSTPPATRNPTVLDTAGGGVVAEVGPSSPPPAARNAVADEVGAVDAEVVPPAPLYPPAAPLWPPVSAPLPSGPPRSGPMSPLKSTTTAGGLPNGACIAPKVTTSLLAMVVAAGERSPSWIAVSSAERSAGETAVPSQEATAEEEAMSSFVPLRRRTTVDAEVGVDGGRRQGDRSRRHDDGRRGGKEGKKRKADGAESFSPSETC